MGRMQIVLSDVIEDKLRKRVGHKKKGAISKAIEEALIIWLVKKV